MKKYKKIILVLLCMFLGKFLLAEEVQKVASGNPSDKTENQVLKNQNDRISYSIGVDIGNNLRKQSIEVNPDSLFEGFKNSYSKTGKLLMTEDEMKETMLAFQKEIMSKRAAEMEKIGEKNKKEGEEFLNKNKTKKGVKTLKSGLQYKIIENGKGETPKTDDVVSVNYKGTLINGTEFDSSYKRGQPISFPVNGVIAGWTEALQLMKVGAKWELYIPPDLAYGAQGAGQDIGPNSTLIFEIELLSIQKKTDKDKEK